MQSDKLRKLACLIREDRVSIGERAEWADQLVAWAERIEALEAERRLLATALGEERLEG